MLTACSYLVHVQAYGSQHWQDYLDFRDALLADPDLAAEYEALKLDLARQFPDDRSTYGDRKTSFVARVLNHT